MLGRAALAAAPYRAMGAISAACGIEKSAKRVEKRQHMKKNDLLR
jgi:hypothetical protein